jgi:excisionase family DNA binding protein
MEDEAKTQEPSWPTIGMTTAEVARSLRCDLKTVQDAIRDGGLPARLVGRGFRVEESALRQ